MKTVTTRMPTASADGMVHLQVSRDQVPEYLVQAHTLAQSGRIMDGLALLTPRRREALRKTPAEAADAVDLIMSQIYVKAEDAEEAEYWLKRMADRRPNAVVMSELASLYQGLGRLSEAWTCRRRAVALDPLNPFYRGAYALDSLRMGHIQEGIQQVKQILADHPEDGNLHSSLLWYMHYLPDHDREDFFRAHCLWGKRHAPAHLIRSSHANDPVPDRPLRIGYVSADFRRHSVAYNFEPFLAGRDTRSYEVFGYANVSKPDDMTERLAGRFDHYRNVCGLDDASLDQLILQDRIDILVHLGGHTEGHRLGALAYKPAPIQVDYGGINTSGMSQIDYRLTDDLLDPPDTQAWYLETLTYLPGGLVCYRPPDFAPGIGPLPAAGNGYVTFGSFNNHNKINEDVLGLWAEVLATNQGARLIIKCVGGRDPILRARYLAFFRDKGIVPERIQVMGVLPDKEHLALYHQVDVALDTFPFNGCITSLEALWMGVPVVSLVGDGYVSRVGLTILKRLGLECLAASTPRDYVVKAGALARSTEHLARMRGSMRQRMLTNDLCNAHRLAGEAETAYRAMWHQWCRKTERTS